MSFPPEQRPVKRFHTWGGEENATRAKEAREYAFSLPLPAQWSSTSNTKATVCQCASDRLPRWQQSLPIENTMDQISVGRETRRLTLTLDMDCKTHTQLWIRPCDEVEVSPFPIPTGSPGNALGSIYRESIRSPSGAMSESCIKLWNSLSSSPIEKL